MNKFYFKILIFLLCIPSGGILLLKIYGVIQMHHSVYNLFIPSAILLIIGIFISYKAYSETFNLIIIGAIGGLIGTLGYDIVRVPFMLMGSRIFAPINMYGVWISNSNIGFGLTDMIGWLYHFSNGISFGVMYALFMKNKSFWWAILYALLLETIFVISPFGDLFGLTSKPLALFTAYLGHVAYGYPLGKMLQNFDKSVLNLKFFRKPIKLIGTLLIIGILIRTLSFETKLKSNPQIVLTDQNIKPSIVRISLGNPVLFQNKRSTHSTLEFILNKEEIKLMPNHEISKIFNEPGIFQLKLKEDQKMKSIFLLIEPVENFNKKN